MFVRSVHKVDARPGSAIGSQPVNSNSVCQVPGCSMGIQRRYLMCAKHWFEVPLEVRLEVSRSMQAWLGGSETGRYYMAARLTAIIHVGKLHCEDMAILEAKLERVREDIKTEFEGGTNHE